MHARHYWCLFVIWNWPAAAKNPDAAYRDPRLAQPVELRRHESRIRGPYFAITESQV